MSMLWTFQALDTLFFRDGTPFQIQEVGMIQPRSMFPPLITPLQGAIRTSLARYGKQGWKPGDPLPKPLGDENHLGDLRLKGPYLLWKGEPLFPTPLYLFGRKGGDIVRLRPGEKPVRCDLGEVHLPELPGERIEGDVIEGWLTKEGMETVLSGKEPATEQIWLASEMWREEKRTGIARNWNTRTAEKGHLYSITQIRPKSGLRLAVQVDGVPDDWEVPKSFFVPLGGEGRFAHVEIGEMFSFPKMPEFKQNAEGKYRVTVSLVTPGKFPGKMKEVVKNGPLVDEIGPCVSACVGKMMLVGGWDLKQGKSRPLTSYLPPGTTWFYELEEDRLEILSQLHGSCVGAQREQSYGFNQIFIGTW